MIISAMAIALSFASEISTAAKYEPTATAEVREGSNAPSMDLLDELTGKVATEDGQSIPTHPRSVQRFVIRRLASGSSDVFEVEVLTIGPERSTQTNAVVATEIINSDGVGEGIKGSGKANKEATGSKEKKTNQGVGGKSSSARP